MKKRKQKTQDETPTILTQQKQTVNFLAWLTPNRLISTSKEEVRIVSIPQ
jgi:hypothetical protein